MKYWILGFCLTLAAILLLERFPFHIADDCHSDSFYELFRRIQMQQVKLQATSPKEIRDWCLQDRDCNKWVDLLNDRKVGFRWVDSQPEEKLGIVAKCGHYGFLLNRRSVGITIKGTELAFDRNVAR